MKKIEKIGLVLFGFVASVGVAYATTGWWGDAGELDEPRYILIEKEMDGVEITVEITRGIVANGQMQISADIEMDTIGVLSGLEVWTANDANSNNVIEASEWTTVATGTVTESNGITTGSTASAAVDYDVDAIRVYQVRTNGHDTWDDYADGEVTFQD